MSLLQGHKLRVVREDREILSVGHIEVERGEVLAVIGPNGAGKSTLVQTLGLLGEFEGTIELDKTPVRDRLAARRRMAVVFQDPLLLNTSVQANVEAGLSMRGVGAKDRRERARHWLKRFDVEALAGRQARTLSGGEAQRVALARAFALEPEVLLLDEPFASLDAPTREALITDLERVLRDSPVGTVFVTHDRDEAMRLGDRVAVLIEGRLRQMGTPAEVFSAPVDAVVADFVGVETVCRGVVQENDDGLLRVECGGADVVANGEIEAGAPVLVCLRPEDVTLVEGALPRSSARNHLSGRVTMVSGAGRLVRVELDCGMPLVALVTRLSAQELDIREGQELTAIFKASAVHLIPAH
ncbi:MAG TPA: ABC transporter ATP-binding protein [Dehalococcoidia bacterium]|nr:ABC transporter ATP-binding protein [Dehalococcoidia bacterium]